MNNLIEQIPLIYGNTNGRIHFQEFYNIVSNKNLTIENFINGLKTHGFCHSEYQ